MLVGITQVAHAQTSPAAGEEINEAPLRELAVTVKTSLESKEFDFDKPFVVEYTGVISKDGKLDLKTGKFSRVEGDKKCADIAKQAIVAISDSGYFAYLRDTSIDNVVILIEQTASDVTARLSASTISETRARSLQSVLSTLILVAKDQINKPEATENDKVNLDLLKATTVTSHEKNLVITISLPKTIFHEIIKSKLAK